MAGLTVDQLSASFDARLDNNAQNLILFSASFNTRIEDLQEGSVLGKVNTLSGSHTALSASFTSNSASVSSRINSTNSNQNTLSASVSDDVVSVKADIDSLNDFSASITASFNSLSASVSSNSASFSSRINTLRAGGVSYDDFNELTQSLSGVFSSSAQLNNATITNLTITNLTTINETSSVIYSSGSNQFGDNLADNQILSGSVYIVGSGSLNGYNLVTSNDTASFLTSLDGALSASAQVLNGSGIFSSSAQLPTGLVSGSSQITALGFITSSTSIATGSFATTGSNQFIGQQNINGDLIVTGSTLSVMKSTDSEPFFNVDVNSKRLTLVQGNGEIPGEFSLALSGSSALFPRPLKTTLYTARGLRIIAGQVGTQHEMSGSLLMSGSIDMGQSNTIGQFGNLILGSSNVSTGSAGVVIGNGSSANGQYAVSLGSSLKSDGQSSLAQGALNTALANYSHAEGQSTRATGLGAHSEGSVTLASGDFAHSEGRLTSASANFSNAKGVGTIAAGVGQLAIGRYNIADNTTSVFVIGNGVDNSNRKDIVNVTTSSVQISGSLLMSGSIVPAVGSGEATSSFSLGSATNAWKDIFVSNGTINFLDGAGNPQGALSTTANGIQSDGDIYVNSNVRVGKGPGTNGLNTTVGMGALQSNTTGTNNTAFGGGALGSNTTGSLNTAVGLSSLAANTTGYYNTAVGQGALYTNNGIANTAVGVRAGNIITIGHNNTAMGYEALSNVVEGTTNLAIGYQAGIYASGSSSNNVFIGYQAGPASYATVNGKLYIDWDSNNTPLIGGDFQQREVTINGMLNVTTFLTLPNQNEFPTNPSPVLGSMVVKDSKLYFYNGTAWKEVSLVP